MVIEALAKGQAVARVVIGTGLVVAPAVFGRFWTGPAAPAENARVLARAVGPRDLALGAGGLLAVREGDPRWIARSFAAQAVADAVDVVALAAAGDSLPVRTRAIGGTMAGGSAVVAALYAAGAARRRGRRLPRRALRRRD